MGRSITRREALALAGLGAIAGAAGCSAGEPVTDEKDGATEVASIEEIGDTSGWDASFYQPAYASVEEARVAAEAVAEEVEAGGIVLLRNEGGTLPLASLMPPMLGCPASTRQVSTETSTPVRLGTL